ncbi:HAD family hydrolase [Candidatus Phytoplasma australiense]|uniref:HAD family hydrolase n=1 Tax=Phytoplasma australiense TaxID=59748 RepID=UPI002A4E21B7|nr:HAD hydrolase family protein [Candidatus Phytoplasma australiense]
MDADSKEFMINEECGQQPSLNEPIYKINLFHHDVQRVVNFLKEFSQFNAYFWKSGAVSLSAKVVSKAYGIAPIQKLYPDHQLICVGDGCNDEEMFRAANLSILMENTKYDYLKKIAKLIAPDIQNDRLFDFFQKHDLIY